jgi:sec-independent protein translocase protein TatA
MNAVLIFFNLGGGEILIVLLFILLFFGSKKIPEFARGLGKGIRQFKDATDGIQRDIQNTVTEVKNEVNVNTQQFKESLKQDDNDKNND